MRRVSEKSGEHDLKFKTNNIKKWLLKGHHVKATIVNQKSETSGGPVSVEFN